MFNSSLPFAAVSCGLLHPSLLTPSGFCHPRKCLFLLLITDLKTMNRTLFHSLPDDSFLLNVKSSLQSSNQYFYHWSALCEPVQFENLEMAVLAFNNSEHSRKSPASSKDTKAVSVLNRFLQGTKSSFPRLLLPSQTAEWEPARADQPPGDAMTTNRDFPACVMASKTRGKSNLLWTYREILMKETLKGYAGSLAPGQVPGLC